MYMQTLQMQLDRNVELLQDTVLANHTTPLQPISINLSFKIMRILENLPKPIIYNLVTRQDGLVDVKYNQQLYEINEMIDKMMFETHCNAVNFNYLFTKILPNQLTNYQVIKVWRSIFVLLHYAQINGDLNISSANNQQKQYNNVKLIIKFSNSYDMSLAQFIKFDVLDFKQCEVDVSILFYGILNFQFCIQSLNILTNIINYAYYNIGNQDVMSNLSQQYQQQQQFIEQYKQAYIQNIKQQFDINQINARSITENIQLLQQIAFYKVFKTDDQLNDLKGVLLNVLRNFHNAENEFVKQLKYQFLLLDVPVLFTGEILVQNNNMLQQYNQYLIVKSQARKFVIELRLELDGIINNGQNVFCTIPITDDNVILPQIYFMGKDPFMEQICQIEVKENEPLSIPKKVFLIQQNNSNVFLHNLFSVKVNKYITKLQPKFDNMIDKQSFQLVNDIFGSLKKQNIQLYLDYDMHVPITHLSNNVGNQVYQPFYKQVNRPVMVQNISIDLLIPDIQIHDDEFSNGNVKRIMLDYNNFQTILYVMEEIQTFCFKFQPKGLILKGLIDIPDHILQYLDYQLFKNFPNVQFFAYIEVRSITFQKIYTIGNNIKLNNEDNSPLISISQLFQKFSTSDNLLACNPTTPFVQDIYLFNNTLQDIILFNTLKEKSLLFQTQFIQATINDINLITLQNNSRLRHQKHRYCQNTQLIKLNQRIISVENSFETYIYNQLTNESIQVLDIQIQLNNQIILIIVDIKNICKRFIIFNLGAALNYQLFTSDTLHSAQIDNNQLLKIVPNTQFYLEPYQNIVYAFEVSSNKEYIVDSNYLDCFVFSEELDGFTINLEPHTVLTLDAVYGKQIQQNPQTEQNSQVNHHSELLKIYKSLVENSSDFQVQKQFLTKAYQRVVGYQATILNSPTQNKPNINIVELQQQQYLKFYNFCFHSLFGVYLMILDQVQNKNIYQQSTFSGAQFEVLKLIKDDMKEIYSFYILQLLLSTQCPLNDIYVFGIQYTNLQQTTKRAVSVLFPPFMNQQNQESSGSSYSNSSQDKMICSNVLIDDILNGKHYHDILIVASRISEKVAVLANLLAERQKVLLVTPFYEMPTGLETIPDHLLGQVQYQYRNIYVDFLGAEVGIHMASRNNLQTILLHSFQYFFDANQLASEAQQKNFFSKILCDSTCDNGAEILLQRGLILRQFLQQILIKQQLPPKLIISMQGCSIITVLSLQQFYKHFLITTQIRSEQPIIFHQPKFVCWEAINKRNIFDNKNDINGYKVYNMCYINEILNQLQIEQYKVLDSYHPGSLFTLRGGMQFDFFITNDDIDQGIKKQQHLNWIRRDESNCELVSESLQGVMKVFLKLQDLLMKQK